MTYVSIIADCRFANKWWLTCSKQVLILIYIVNIDSTVEEKDVMKMESCRFERNRQNNNGNKSMIHINSGNIFINDSTFDHNQNVIKVSEGSANFTNCIFNNNFASLGGVTKVFSGSMQFANCSFNNNVASIDAGVLLA